MKYELSAKELRVIGAMLEKQVTVPEQYPMSLNGITLACNQKTNRDPVYELSEHEVQQQIDLLVRKHFLRTVHHPSSRVMKYAQRFCNSEFGQLKFSVAEVAIITSLLLRGAQTAGELRTRTNRLHEFADVSEVEQVLHQLARREDGPFVVRLAREAGKRESRFTHLFAGAVQGASDEESAFNEPSAERHVSATTSQHESLQARVTALEAQVLELTSRLEAFLAQAPDQQ